MRVRSSCCAGFRKQKSLPHHLGYRNLLIRHRSPGSADEFFGGESENICKVSLLNSSILKKDFDFLWL